MKKIYAPWRSNYLSQSEITSQPDKLCVFCKQFSENQDKKNYIIKRYTHCAVMLNLYPYNAGHSMILPYKHVANFADLTSEIRSELMEVISQTITIIQDSLGCTGINMGTNQGKAAGGSISDHIHVHILPRWLGDTNFLAALADTKQISFDLKKIYEQLVKAFGQQEEHNC